MTNAPIASTESIERAKQLARLLRADLAAAGLDISHSLALEIVAHQHGARDWNSFHAMQPRSIQPGSNTAKMLQRRDQGNFVHHQAPSLSVGELREALENLPADVPVLVTYPLRPGTDADRTTIVGESAWLRPNPYAPGPALNIEGNLPSGVYQRGASLTITVSGLPAKENGSTATQLIESVKTAIRKVEYQGRTSMSNSADEGLITWTWSADQSSLEALVPVVRQTIRQFDPGDWRVTESFS